MHGVRYPETSKCSFYFINKNVFYTDLKNYVSADQAPKSHSDLETHSCLNQILDLLFSSEDESSDEESDTSDSEDDALEKVLESVLSDRYIEPLVNCKRAQHFLDVVVPELGDDDFRQEARMSRDAFYKICDMVRMHSVFYNNSRLTQECVEVQLIVALNGLGTSGNGASFGRIARYYGLSQGSVDWYTSRVSVALLPLESRTVTWPNSEEKKLIRHRIYSKSGFPHCIGVVDGTDIVLSNKPALYGVDYYSQKRRYSIPAMVISDDQRKLRHIFCGFRGSSHDGRVYRNSKLLTRVQDFFEAKDVILADSAYACTTTAIPPYKKPAALSPENERFEYFLSSSRSCSSISSACLKGGFGACMDVAHKNEMRKPSRAPINVWSLLCFAQSTASGFFRPKLDRP